MNALPNEPRQRNEQPKSHQLSVRIPDLLDAQLDHAAELEEMSRAEFVRAAIQEKAEAVLSAHQLIILSDRDMDALLEAIANPPPPNEAMLRSIARWREHFDHDESPSS